MGMVKAERRNCRGKKSTISQGPAKKKREDLSKVQGILRAGRKEKREGGNFGNLLGQDRRDARLTSWQQRKKAGRDNPSEGYDQPTSSGKKRIGGGLPLR